jgi:hypothetical protein
MCLGFTPDLSRVSVYLSRTVFILLRCAAGWLSVRAARCTVRGLFAMRCAARGLVAFARCAVMHGMRCAGRCAANWLRCNALRCAARCVDCLRCDALRAGWLLSRGAGGAMLLTEGFLGWDGWPEGWVDGWSVGWMDGVMGGMGGWCDGFKGWFH